MWLSLGAVSSWVNKNLQNSLLLWKEITQCYYTRQWGHFRWFSHNQNSKFDHMSYETKLNRHELTSPAGFTRSLQSSTSTFSQTSKEKMNGTGQQSRKCHLESNFQVCQNPPKLHKPACVMWKDVPVLFFSLQAGRKDLNWHTGLKFY